MSEHRIVSLIASATEIVCALGFEDSLVGRSHECDFPESICDLPVCSDPRIDVNGTSRQIDERVKASLKDAVSVYKVRAEVLDELRPTVVVTQTQCEVCAVSLKDVESALCNMVSSRPNLVSLEPNELDDVWRDIERVGEALNASDRANDLLTDLKRRLDSLASETAKIADRPTIACIEWTDPLMAAGNWVPTLVHYAGGSNLFGEEGKHAPWMTIEQLVERDPDVIVVMPCGFGIERTRPEMPPLTSHPNWPKLKAVQTGRVYLADGNQYFNRPGPRLVESAEILAEILHPGQFDFGHQGPGWQVFQSSP